MGEHLRRTQCWNLLGRCAIETLSREDIYESGGRSFRRQLDESVFPYGCAEGRNSAFGYELGEPAGRRRDDQGILIAPGVGADKVLLSAADGEG